MVLGYGAVFLAGLATLLTPCVLPMLPVYLTLLLGEGLESAKGHSGRYRLVTATIWFIVGFGAVFVSLGLAASAAAATLASHRSLLVIISGAAIATLGAKQLGIIRIPWLDRTLQPLRGNSPRVWLNGLLFGFAFAIGWTPCVGPILGAVLTYAAAATSSSAEGALLLLVYTAGLGLPLLGIAIAADRVLPLLRRLHPFLPKFERAVGAIMFAAGVYLTVPTLWGALFSDASDSRASRGLDATPVGQPSAQARLVEFYSENCPICEKMAPLVDQLRADCEAQGLEVLQLDMSDPAHRAAAARFGVRAVPSFHLLESSGAEAATVLGKQNMDQLRALAAKAVEGPPCANDSPVTPAPMDGPGCALHPSSSKARSTGAGLDSAGTTCSEDS